MKRTNRLQAKRRHQSDKQHRKQVQSRTEDVTRHRRNRPVRRRRHSRIRQRTSRKKLDDGRCIRTRIFDAGLGTRQRRQGDGCNCHQNPRIFRTIRPHQRNLILIVPHGEPISLGACASPSNDRTQTLENGRAQTKAKLPRKSGGVSRGRFYVPVTAERNATHTSSRRSDSAFLRSPAAASIFLCRGAFGRAS